uniref:uncharacterized protein LOC105349662 n=1 Tax=Fragaria vesca subsp. vesca TaxID=101020 RepID=UPI0005C94B23|nr:PREDICTED: uncharacterized protein LOC105349662 [Fragaria vesca subsp. vesca]
MIPELKNLKKMFEDRFGKDFVVADNVQEEMISWLSNEPTHGKQLERAQKIAKKHKIDLNYSADTFVSGHHPDSDGNMKTLQTSYIHSQPLLLLIYTQTCQTAITFGALLTSTRTT